MKMYWTPVILADVDEYNFANAEIHFLYEVTQIKYHRTLNVSQHVDIWSMISAHECD